MGNGYVKVKEDLLVKIPAGINNGQQIKVKEKGDRGINGGPNGDLYVEVIVQEHNIVKRDGNDIHIEIPLDIVDATLGTTIDIPTVYKESVSLKIPAGIQNDNVLRLKGEGVKDLRSGVPGDQFVHVNIKTPTMLNKKQRELLEAFRKEETDNVFKRFIKSFKK